LDLATSDNGIPLCNAPFNSSGGSRGLPSSRTGSTTHFQAVPCPTIE
ncbi:hypothetical protein Tco_1127775, partial [Tanacetum coccineum]